MVRASERRPGAGIDGRERLYYTNDANMNVTALVDRKDGAVVDRVLYDPYGRPKFYNGYWANPSDTSTFVSVR